MDRKKVWLWNLRYMSIYAVYWVVYCILFSYTSVYLLGHGYTNRVIGIIMAVANVAALVLQPLTADVADRTEKGKIKNMICGLILLMGASVAGLLVVQGSGIFMAVLYVVALMILMVIQPLLNSMAFIFEQYGMQLNFGMARATGSLFFALASIVVGYAVDAYGVEILPQMVCVILIPLLLLVFTFRVRVPRQEVKQNEVTAEEKKKTETDTQIGLLAFVVKYKRFMCFLGGCTLMIAAHNIINSFFIQILSPLGGGSADMGVAFFIGAMVEIPANGLFTRIEKKINCATLLIISSIAFVIKHGIALFAPSVEVLLAAQPLQFFGYGLFTAASVYYASRVVEPQDVVKGQAFVTGMLTLSCVLASAVGGALIHENSTFPALLTGEILTVIGLVIVWISVGGRKNCSCGDSGS
ncbi:MAG: MFS transporter [Roseburia sp.]